MCLYYYYCSLCAKKAFEMSGAVFGNHALGQTSSRCNVSAVKNKPTFHLLIQKKLQNEPSCKSLYSTICVTKCAFLWLSVRTFTVGHIFPLFLSFYFRFVVSVLLLQIQVFLLCSALPHNVSDNKLRTNPKGRTLAFFRSEAFRGKMHPEFKSEVLQDESRKALIWAKLRLAGRTALVNDADWRVLSQPDVSSLTEEQSTSLKAFFDFTVLSLASVNLKIISVKSY